jgi:hypothetical protein
MSKAASCGATIVLVFMARRDVEATNNGASGRCHPSVIFRRVTNGFRSE